MLSEQQLQWIAEQTYWVEKKRTDVEHHPEENEDYAYDRHNENLGKFHVIKTEDNLDNGMQAMAVVPMVNGQPDYSQIIITYAGTNFDDDNDVETDVQMIGFGNTDTVLVKRSDIDVMETESQANTALKFAAEIRQKYRNAQITTTGHSLGQALAAYVALKNGWYNVGFNGPDIHNMISEEEVAYMRANPQQFKNYRANFDYIGGITGNATNTAIHMDYAWALYTHDLADWQFDENGNVIHRDRDIVWQTPSPEVDINGDGQLEFRVGGLDARPRNLLSLDNDWIRGYGRIKIKVDTDLLHTLSNNLWQRAEDIRIIRRIILAAIEKNKKVTADFSQRKEKISESIKEVFKEQGLPSLLQDTNDSIGEIVKYQSWLEVGARRVQIDMGQFHAHQTPLVNGIKLNPTIQDVHLVSFSNSCADLLVRITQERTYDFFSVFGGGTPTILKSWQVVDRATQSLLKDSDAIFEGEGLREGKEDGISESLAIVLEKILENTQEIRHGIANVRYFIDSIAKNFAQADEWLGKQLAAGRFVSDLKGGAVPTNYQAYLERDAILDDVRDVLQAFDRQVEKNSADYAKKVAQVYQESLGQFEAGLYDWVAKGRFLEANVKGLIKSFSVSIDVEEKHIHQELVGDKWVDKVTYPVTRWGELRRLYPTDTQEAVEKLNELIVPTIDKVEQLTWRSRDMKTALTQLEPRLKPIIEDGVYRAFDLDEIVKGLRHVALISERLGAEIDHVLHVIDGDGMQALAINTLKQKLSETHQLIAFYTQFVNDCFGDNSPGVDPNVGLGTMPKGSFSLN